MANDTTTTLNAGTGGDVMDESLVTQDDGVTKAKRPRVVVGSDDGSLQTLSDTGSVVEAQVADDGIRSALGHILLEARRQTALLRLLLAASGHEGLALEDIDALASEEA